MIDMASTYSRKTRNRDTREEVSYTIGPYNLWDQLGDPAWAKRGLNLLPLYCPLSYGDECDDAEGDTPEASPGASPGASPRASPGASPGARFQRNLKQILT